jgi:hypothetical protein
LGQHQLVFVASDGHSTSTLSIGVTVVKNSPPQDELSSPDAGTTVVGNNLRGAIVRDRDGDTLSLKIISLPTGATLNASGAEIFFDWTPAEANLGENSLDFEVSDGELTTHIRKSYPVLPAWTQRGQFIYLAPGAGYSFYSTSGDGHAYNGVNFSLMLYSHTLSGSDAFDCRRGTDGVCPSSQLGFYLTSELLFPSHSGDSRTFTYAFGVTRSFEFGPVRNWLVPYASAEVGGCVDARGGHLAQVSPLLGVHLWANRHVWLDLNGGYRMIPAELRQVSGPRAVLSLMVNAW